MYVRTGSSWSFVAVASLDQKPGAWVSFFDSTRAKWSIDQSHGQLGAGAKRDPLPDRGSSCLFGGALPGQQGSTPPTHNRPADQRRLRSCSRRRTATQPVCFSFWAIPISRFGTLTPSWFFFSLHSHPVDFHYDHTSPTDHNHSFFCFFFAHRTIHSCFFFFLCVFDKLDITHILCVTTGLMSFMSDRTYD